MPADSKGQRQSIPKERHYSPRVPYPRARATRVSLHAVQPAAPPLHTVLAERRGRTNGGDNPVTHMRKGCTAIYIRDGGGGDVGACDVNVSPYCIYNESIYALIIFAFSPRLDLKLFLPSSLLFLFLSRNFRLSTIMCTRRRRNYIICYSTYVYNIFMLEIHRTKEMRGES